MLGDAQAAFLWTDAGWAECFSRRHFVQHRQRQNTHLASSWLRTSKKSLASVKRLHSCEIEQKFGILPHSSNTLQCIQWKSNTYDGVQEVHLQVVDSFDVQLSRRSPLVVEDLLLLAFIVQVLAGNHLTQTEKTNELAPEKHPSCWGPREKSTMSAAIVKRPVGWHTWNNTRRI